MKIKKYGHNRGDELVPVSTQETMHTALTEIDFVIRKRCAEELREVILRRLKELGWSNPVPVVPQARITITAVNGDTGLCLQFGNIARAYADLLKMQVFYERGNIRHGVFIVPTLTTARTMGSNLANFTRIAGELVYYRNIVTVPILMLGVGEE